MMLSLNGTSKTNPYVIETLETSWDVIIGAFVMKLEDSHRNTSCSTLWPIRSING